LKQAAAEMPPGVNWERLAAEMTANIRVGLAAGECVAPRRRKPVAFAAWKPAAIATGAVAIVSAAWWLNLPSSDADSLARSLGSAARTLVYGARQPGPVLEAKATEAPGEPQAEEQESPGAMLQVSPDGVELKQNGVPARFRERLRSRRLRP
jgi:hypothetical protein